MSQQRRISEEKVRNILKMYETIQFFLRNSEDQELIRITKFPGFDGNYETSAMVKAKKFVNNGEYSVIPIKEDFNSHSGMIDYYMRCLEKFDESNLSEESIRYFLNLN